MNQDPILIQLLESAGLNEKESKVYLSVLETGQTTIQGIAKISGLKRPIIYVILEELSRRGLVSDVPNKKTKTYQAADPSIISAQMQTATKNFSEMLPIFRTLANRGDKKPKLSYFDTKEGILGVFNEINRQKSAVFIASHARLNQHFPSASTNWQKGYVSNFNKLESRTIIPDNPKDIDIARDFMRATDKTKFRTLSVFDECNMDIAVYGNKLAITTFEDVPFLVLIESTAVPTFFLPIFEILWKTAKEIKL